MAITVPTVTTSTMAQLPTSHRHIEHYFHRGAENALNGGNPLCPQQRFEATNFNRPGVARSSAIS